MSKLPGGVKKYVILNVVKNPTEELTGIYFSLWSWDISLTLNMTYFLLSPSGKVSATPTIGDKKYGNSLSREI